MEKIPAPFDGKNLVDDSLRDDVFRDCYQCDDMTDSRGHLLGHVSADTDEVWLDAIVDVRWSSSWNTLRIELMACPAQSDFFSMRDDFFRYYEQVFRQWEQDSKENGFDGKGFYVEFKREGNVLFASFWWDPE